MTSGLYMIDTCFAEFGTAAADMVRIVKWEEADGTV